MEMLAIVLLLNDKDEDVEGGAETREMMLVVPAG
jgi:hypothetical protein